MTEKEKKVKEKKVKSPAKAKKDGAETAEVKSKSPVKAKNAPKSESTVEKKPRTKAANTKDAADAIAPMASSGPQRVPSKAKSTTAAKQETTPAPAPSHHEIAQLAHRFWKERGGHHGAHEQDWFRAEQELRGKAS